MCWRTKKPRSIDNKTCYAAWSVTGLKANRSKCRNFCRMATRRKHCSLTFTSHLRTSRTYVIVNNIIKLVDWRFLATTMLTDWLRSRTCVCPSVSHFTGPMLNVLHWVRMRIVGKGRGVIFVSHRRDCLCFGQGFTNKYLVVKTLQLMR